MDTKAKHIAYQERVRIQCRQWVDGVSKHNTIDDECCPDFSCCHPALFITDQVKRRAHYDLEYGICQ